MPVGGRAMAIRALGLSLLALSVACQTAGPSSGGGAASGAATSGAPSEQVVRLPSPEPPTLDPGLATDGHSIDIISQIFEGLVTFDDAGAVSGAQAQGWRVSD